MPYYLFVTIKIIKAANHVGIKGIIVRQAGATFIIIPEHRERTAIHYRVHIADIVKGVVYAYSKVL